MGNTGNGVLLRVVWGEPKGSESIMLNRLGHEVKNRWQALRSYSDMSPDLKLRRRVNRSLLNRPDYAMNEWHQRFWRPLGIRIEVVEFVYQSLAKYSGLVVGRLVPSDRMVADLQLPLICWFDWEMTCMDAFWQQFDPTGSAVEAIDGHLQEIDPQDGDINDASCDPTTFETLNDWMIFLNQAATRSTSALKS
jgi:hypothetical protein